MSEVSSLPQISRTDHTNQRIFSDPEIGNLLRVPKAGTRAFNYQVLQRYWDEMIKPEFEPDQLVRQRLVQLYSSNIVERLNEHLATVHGRRADFVGSKVDDVEFGMLVEDMRQSKPNPLIYYHLSLLLPRAFPRSLPRRTRAIRD